MGRIEAFRVIGRFLRPKTDEVVTSAREVGTDLPVPKKPVSKSDQELKRALRVWTKRH